ncbi:MAG: hypothetical protein BBJ57_12565 [Desulfobacterales bacterium PC51MH44]|nr:MAG: hypothetical protein BBJ57_12565 [Desulfobacterales bacterium PC51MH44]
MLSISLHLFLNIISVARFICVVKIFLCWGNYFSFFVYQQTDSQICAPVLSIKLLMLPFGLNLVLLSQAIPSIFFCEG